LETEAGCVFKDLLVTGRCLSVDVDSAIDHPTYARTRQLNVILRNTVTIQVDFLDRHVLFSGASASLLFLDTLAYVRVIGEYLLEELAAHLFRCFSLGGDEAEKTDNTGTNGNHL
jgi:hypothetical protein